MTSTDRTKDSAASVAAAILPKVQEARRIVDSARWGLLDVLIWLNEVEDDLAHSSKNALRAVRDDFDPTGLMANRTDSEAREYRPDNEPDW